MRSSCESMATPCGSNPSHFLPSNSTAPNWATKTRKSSQPDFKRWPPKKQLSQQEQDTQALFRESAVRLRRDVWGGRPGGGRKNFVDCHFVGEKQCFGLVAVETGKRAGSFTAKNCVKLLSAKFTGALGPENLVTAQKKG